MMGRRKTLCVLILVLSLIGIPTSHADRVRLRDADDATGPLDIAWTRHGHRTNDKSVRQLDNTVRLYERWPVQRLRHRGYINLFFDLPGNPDWREERAVYVSYEDGKLRAEMIDFGADPPEPMRYVSLRRPDHRTIKVIFRKSLLGKGNFNRYMRHAVYIEESHELCGESGGCEDLTDNLRHDL